VTLRVDHRRYPPAVEAALYFLCTEGLTNVARHANARTVDLVVESVGNFVVATLTDDGLGTADPSRGTGLRGLTDRVAALGGRLTVGQTTGGGTVLAARIPLVESPLVESPLVESPLVESPLVESPLVESSLRESLLHESSLRGSR
jgi:glucose-6-phosphate-specific signal transduction histidine kinase